MTSTAAHPVPAARLRVLPLVLGIVTVLVALGFLAAGGAGAWGLSQRGGSGYVTSGTHRLSTGSYAIVSERIDAGTDVPDWVFGDHFAKIRIEATSLRPVFLGIGRTDAVERYLAAVQYDRVDNFDLDPFSVDYHHLAGTASPAPPAGQSFWRVKASGAGSQTIEWALEKGSWTAVAMNADGSKGVTLDARFGARIPFLMWVTIVTFAAGGLLLVLGGWLVRRGTRHP
jgi:hypothetical protein